MSQNVGDGAPEFLDWLLYGKKTNVQITAYLFQSLVMNIL